MTTLEVLRTALRNEPELAPDEVTAVERPRPLDDPRA